MRSAENFRHLLFDRPLALLLLLLTLPVVLAAAVQIALFERQWPFYRQLRVGRDGRLFTIFKLRTMRGEAGQKRATRTGAVLRARHLDELPQFLNVLCGSMALIGPRPERPLRHRHLARSLPGFSSRTKCRPGLTGPAQVEQPQVPGNSFLVLRTRLDNAGGGERAIRSDITIILRTVVIVFLGHRSRAGRGLLLGGEAKELRTVAIR